MKIKIIDLLNMIANGEEVPRVIRYDGMFYEFDKELSDYRCNGYRLFGNELEESYELIEHLKDEVEILEITITYNQDNKQDKIEEINLWENLQGYTIKEFDTILRILTKNYGIIGNKINEIIDVLNKE